MGLGLLITLVGGWTLTGGTIDDDPGRVRLATTGASPTASMAAHAIPEDAERTVSPDKVARARAGGEPLGAAAIDEVPQHLIAASPVQGLDPARPAPSPAPLTGAVAATGAAVPSAAPVATPVDDAVGPAAVAVAPGSGASRPARERVAMGKPVGAASPTRTAGASGASAKKAKPTPELDSDAALLAAMLPYLHRSPALSTPPVRKKAAVEKPCEGRDGGAACRSSECGAHDSELSACAR